MKSKLLRKNNIFRLICLLLPILFVPTGIAFGQATGDVQSAEPAEVKEKKSDSTSDEADEDEEEEEDC